MTTRSPDASTPPNDAPTLQAALKLVDEVVHDLNNALLVIRGYGSVLRTSLETPEQLADVDEIAKAVDHATLLTGKLLELARSGRPEGGDVRPLAPGTETILLVEDDDTVRDLTRQALELNGYRVFTAASPGEALELGDEVRYELLLTDVVMPQMRGDELAKRLCRDRPGLKTLFMSGYLDSEAQLGEAESAAFLQKPFSLAELARTVRDLLDS